MNQDPEIDLPGPIPRYLLKSFLRCPACTKRLSKTDLAGCDVDRIVCERLTPPICADCQAAPLTEPQQVVLLAGSLVEAVGNSAATDDVRIAAALLFAEWTAQATAKSINDESLTRGRALLEQVLKANPTPTDPNDLEDEPEPAPETLKG